MASSELGAALSKEKSISRLEASLVNHSLNTRKRGASLEAEMEQFSRWPKGGGDSFTQFKKLQGRPRAREQWKERTRCSSASLQGKGGRSLDSLWRSTDGDTSKKMEAFDGPVEHFDIRRWTHT
jgi:hypothetical protein